MSGTAPAPGRAAWMALALLLAINLFNYIDRYILAAVLPQIKEAFFPGHPEANARMGMLATAFVVSYMVSAPVLGWLADRVPRWRLIGVSVLLWSAASACSGLAGSFAMLLTTRLFVGVGEGGYGPAAPTILSDLFPQSMRGKILSIFYIAIPVGSALGFVLGGQLSAWFESWRWPFYVLSAPGIVLGIACFFMPEPRRGAVDGATPASHRATMRDYLRIFTIPSYVLNTAAMAAMTFAIGGLSYWIPEYLHGTRRAEFAGFAMDAVGDRALLAHVNTMFGGVLVVAGLLATLSGGFLADKLQKVYGGAYFLVSGVGMLLGFPLVIALLGTEFPAAWTLLFFAVFFLFFNTGPANAALANVTHPSVRATAFALNIFMIHAFGDAISPPIIGWMADRWSMNAAFFAMACVMLLSGVLWLTGMKFLARDTQAALAPPSA